MRLRIFQIGLAAMVALGILSGCDHDYLNLRPETSISASEAVATTEAARMSARALARAMFTQYQKIGNPQQCSGEASFNAAINDALGPDDASYFHMRILGSNWYPWKSMAMPVSSFCASAWAYCYNIAGQATTIIDNIADASGPENEKMQIEAIARTYRAHAYIKALQWFAPRWADSEDGKKVAVVLRRSSSTGPAPLGTMTEVLDFIYADLEKAEALFAAAGLEREEIYEPDIRVAYGLHARAALIRNDWKTARAKAHEARQGREVMTMEQYFEGFTGFNDEYLWANVPDEGMFYYSPGAWFSCNGQYPCTKAYCFGINIDLYDRLDARDQRRKLYFMPDRVAEVAAIQGYDTVASLTRADFWNRDFINTSTAAVKNLATPVIPDRRMILLAQGFVKMAIANNPAASRLTMKHLPYSLNKSEWPGSMSLGASVKVWSYGPYCSNVYPYMRAAEMYLTEAEAAYQDGDENTAKACLEAVNSKRIPGYTCNSTGEALLDEIRVCRRIELFAEGHNFPDFKRWNLPFEKRRFVAGDPASGNVPATYAYSVETVTNNGWRLAIPQQELDANTAIDREALGY